MKLPHICSLLLVTVLSVCNNQDSFAQTKPKTVKKTVSTAPKAALVTAKDVAEGQELIASSDCVACHHPVDKLVGPNYSSISEKYPLTAANITALSQKIINGGSGVWGNVPMPPHAGLSQEDAGKIVKYVLALNPKNKAKIAK